MITVQPIDNNAFRVTVEGRTTTTHTVTLSSFELPVISRYFPEYEKTIANMLAGNG